MNNCFFTLPSKESKDKKRIMNKKNKRISFNDTDAIHLYEYLLFYWEGYYSKYPKDRKRMGRFGGCGLCENIGERLERFIGEEEVRQVEKYLIKFRKDLKKENKCLECNSIISEGFFCKKHRWGDNEFLPKPNDGEIVRKN